MDVVIVIAIMPNVAMLSAIMLSIFYGKCVNKLTMQSVITLSVVLLYVFMLSVAAPLFQWRPL